MYICIKSTFNRMKKVITILLSLMFGFSVCLNSLLAQETGKMKTDSLKADKGKPEKDTTVFYIVEEMPQFPGGELALRKYIQEEINYPPNAVKDSIEGKVYVRFVVKPDGSVSDATILRGVSPELDAEALRIINLLPRWRPCGSRSKPRSVYYTIPIHFTLDEKKKK